MEQLRLAFTGKPHILTSTFTSTLTTLHNTNARLLEPFSTGATKIPSTADNKLSEVQHVVDALKINGYTDSFIRSCQNTTTPTPEVQPQSQTRKRFVTLPHIKGISEKIARTLNQFNVNAAHKPVKTVGSILKKPKDKFDQDLSTGVVYKNQLQRL